jgi:hypothetical protein
MVRKTYGKGCKKGEVVPVHAMTACKGEAQLHTRLTSVLDAGERSTSRADHLTAGKEPRYPLKRRVGGPQSRSQHFGEDKNLSPLPEKDVPDT